MNGPDVEESKRLSKIIGLKPDYLEQSFFQRRPSLERMEKNFWIRLVNYRTQIAGVYASCNWSSVKSLLLKS